MRTGGTITPTVLAAALALAAGGCGGHAAPPPARTVTDAAAIPRLTGTAPARIDHPGVRRRGRPGRRHHTRAAPPLGTSQRTVSRGSDLTVTVVRLVDPLTGSGASLLPGTRAVGVFVALSNAGPALYDSSATGDFSIGVSRGTVTPLFIPAGACQTPVEDFDRYMTAGEERSGCVAFAVDVGARVRSVRFTPHASTTGQLGWSVGRG